MKIDYDESNFWPNRIVPYVSDVNDPTNKCLIEIEMLQIMLNSCIKFHSEKNTLFQNIPKIIIKDNFNDFNINETNTCSSSIVMYIEHSQTLIILKKCSDSRIMLGKLMFAIGISPDLHKSDHESKYELDMTKDMSRISKLNLNYINKLYNCSAQMKLYNYYSSIDMIKKVLKSCDIRHLTSNNSLLYRYLDFD